MPNLETGKRIVQESREFDHEKHESREDRESAELKAAAAMERADFLSKEVKTSQNQMQNIIMHMQQVMNAIKKLRAELDLPGEDLGEATSVEEDHRRVKKLQEQIHVYRSELEAMREDLIKEQIQEIAKQQPNQIPSKIEELAKAKVEKIYMELGF